MLLSEVMNMKGKASYARKGSWVPGVKVC